MGMKTFFSTVLMNKTVSLLFISQNWSRDISVDQNLVFQLLWLNFLPYQKVDCFAKMVKLCWPEDWVCLYFCYTSSYLKNVHFMMEHNNLFLQENKVSSEDLPQCLHNCIFVLSLKLIQGTLRSSLSLYRTSLPSLFFWGQEDILPLIPMTLQNL